MMLPAAVLLLVTLATVGTDTAAGSSDQWGELKLAWKAYRAEPTPRNAEHLYRLLPSKHRADMDPELFMEFWGSLEWLEPRIMRGDKWATRIAFRFHAVSDAAFAEDLDEMLGRMIRPQPVLFLQELSANRESYEDIGDIVLSYGTDAYASSATPEKDYLAELEERLATLRSLKLPNAKLRQSRDGCIRLLQKEIADRSRTADN